MLRSLLKTKPVVSGFNASRTVIFMLSTYELLKPTETITGDRHRTQLLRIKRQTTAIQRKTR